MTARKVRGAVRIVSAALAALASVAGGVSTAHAQSLRPHVLFIFDTSGSMLDRGGCTNNCFVGENSNLCPSASTSKLYGLKSALRASLAQVGTDEANFGLMSFAQVVVNNPNTGQWCGGQSWGHYDPTPTVPTMPGIVVPNRTMTGNHSATGYPEGCLMTSNTNETTFGPWFNTGASQVLRVGVTTAGPGVTPAATNYDPVDANIPAIYRWIDNVELPATSGPVTDPELHGLGYTPLGRSLFYSRMYYDGVVKPNDPRAVCRKNVVVLVTDGAETCDEGAAPDGNFSLTTCTGGAAFNPFHPVVQACQLFRQSDIRMYMITDSGLSTGDLAAADRIAAAGGTTAAIRVSLADSNAAKAALVGIIAETVPPVEICNGLDENCNGMIDEGVKNNCALDLTGTLRHCAVETANCVDDDCDGLIDEGFPVNGCGQSAACPLPPELCDGMDNDCDGDIDEGFNVGASCNNGLTGTCRRVGITECAPDRTSVTCNLTGAPTAPEVCNNIDDDCNGMVDDGLGTGQGVGVDCGIQGQGCNKGITRCIAGRIVCEGAAQPTMETCNGRDDDCNGLIDDGTFPGVGDSCLCPPLTMAQAGVGQCRAGRIICGGVSGLQCQGCVLPQPEICNGKDDDCDGMADQMAMCPSGFGCRDGSCGLLCRPGEFPCPQGYDCVQQYCVPNRCRTVQCGGDQKCDNDTGSCVDLCFKISCLSGQTCMRGNCYDCSNSPALACAPGQICTNRQCVKDKCADVKCADGEYCSSGRCVSLTCGSACAANQACIAGQCRSDNCRNVACQGFEYCEEATGACKPNMCVAKTCPFCAPASGECTPDPCANIGCPTDGCWSCAVTAQGEPYCKFGDNCGIVRNRAGSSGGGCSCSVTEGAPWSSSLAVLALFGLSVFTRRRRWR